MNARMNDYRRILRPFHTLTLRQDAEGDRPTFDILACRQVSNL